MLFYITSLKQRGWKWKYHVIADGYTGGHATHNAFVLSMLFRSLLFCLFMSLWIAGNTVISAFSKCRCGTCYYRFILSLPHISSFFTALSFQFTDFSCKFESSLLQNDVEKYSLNHKVIPPAAAGFIERNQDDTNPKTYCDGSGETKQGSKDGSATTVLAPRTPSALLINVSNVSLTFFYPDGVQLSLLPASVIDLLAGSRQAGDAQ